MLTERLSGLRCSNSWIYFSPRNFPLSGSVHAPIISHRNQVHAHTPLVASIHWTPIAAFIATSSHLVYRREENPAAVNELTTDGVSLCRTRSN
jgi:hypothetical protein